MTRALRTLTSTRRRRTAVAGLVVALIGTVGALAYLTSAGAGAGNASVGTLTAPSITGATPGAGSVALTWSTVTPPGTGAVTYYVQRDGGNAGGTCPTSASPTGVTSCTDSGLVSGTYSYVVTAKWRSWTAASGVTTVTVGGGGATHLLLSAASTTPAPGAGDSLTITAKDASNTTFTPYTGDKTLTFGGAANAPDGTHPTVSNKTGVATNFGAAMTITFTNGVATVSGANNGVMKLFKAETASITVTDGSITNGSGLSVTVSAGTAASLGLAAVSTTPTAGVADNLTATAKDVYGNTVTGYTGDKSLTFGGAANAPDGTPPTVTDKTASATNFGTATTVTFASGVASVSGSNNGVMKLYKGETASITVTDGTLTNGSGLSVTVSAATAVSLTLAAASTTPTAGVADNLTTTAKDVYGNIATGYTGDKSLTFGGAANAPDGTHPTVTDKTGSATNFGTATTVTFASGVATVSGASNGVMKLFNVETASITVTDGSITNGSGLSVTVGPAAASSLSLAVASTTPTAGVADSLTTTAKDAFGNTATAYTGDKSLTFGGAANAPNATQPTVTSKLGVAMSFGTATTITFASGVATVSGANNGVMKLYKAETAAITVTDGTITNGSGLSVTVSPASPASMTKTAGDAQSAVVGAAFSTALKVTVKDTYGNPQAAGVSVTFVAPASGASGAFAAAGCTGQPPASTCVVGTASDGTATAAMFTANSTVGANYTVSATATGGSSPSVNFTESNTISGTKTASATGNWCTAGTWTPSGIPSASDDVTITGAAATLTIQSGCAAVANSVTLGNATNSNTTLTFAAASSTLTVGGDVNITGPTAAATRDLQVNAGTMTVGGNLILGTGQTGNQANRVAKLTVTTGTVTVGGNLTYVNIVGANAAQNVINMSGGAGTFNLGGTFTIGNSSGTLTPGTTSTFNFNGSSAQSIPIGVSSVVYNNLNVNNPAGATPSAAISAGNVTGNVQVQSGTLNNGGFAIVGGAGNTFGVAAGATFKLAGTTSAFPSGFATTTLAATSTVEYAGTGAQTVVAQSYGNLTSSSTGARTLANAGTIGIAGTFTQGTNAYTVNGSTVDFNGSVAQTVPVGLTPSYNNLSLDNANASGATLGAAISATNVTGNVTVGSGVFGNGGFAVIGASGKTFAVSAGATFKLSGTTSAFPTGFTTTTLNATSTVIYAGSGAQTIVALSYGNLTSSSTGTRTLAGSGTIGIAGTFTQGTNAYTVNGSTVDFNGSVAQTVPVGLTPSYNNLSLDNSNASGATLGAAITATNVTGSVKVLAGIASNGGLAIAGNAGATFQVAAGETFNLTSTTTFPTGFGTVTLDPASTVNYAGAGAQTIAAQSYGNLTSGSTGARTLASSGTVGIAGTFTPGTNAFTITGSTVNFNGAGAQTIPAFNYNNLTSSSTGARTLAGSGTVGVAGAFTPGTNAFTITGSTVDFNGSGAQTIPAFNYLNLTSSSTGARTLASSGTIGIAGTFTQGTNAYTVTGSTVDFNGSVAQTVPVGLTPSYNNLSLDNSNASGATLVAAITATNVAGNVSVLTGIASNGGFAIAGNAGATFQVASAATFNLTGTSAFPTAFGTVTLGSTSTVNYAGSGAQTVAAQSYGNLTSSSTGARTFASTGTIGVAGTFTQGTNAYTVTGSTVDFNGAGAQTVPAALTPSYNNLTLDNPAGATLGAAITATNVTGNLTVASGSFSNGGFAIAGNAGKAFAVSAGATFTLAGTTSAFPTVFGTVTLAPTSTVSYSGSGAQTVVAQSYGNLTMSAAGARTLASSGTIAIAGTFTRGTNTFTVTGSTIDFNGTGAQTVPIGAAPTYNNLTLDNTNTSGATLGAAITGLIVTGNLSVASGSFDNGGFAITLASTKTFAVASLATFKLTGTTTMVTVSGAGGTKTFGSTSTVNYAGAGQTVTNETYGNLTLSGSGTKTMPATGPTVAGSFSTSGTVSATAGAAMGVTGSFTIGSGTTFNAATFSHTVGGSFSNSGTFTAGTSTFTLNGSGATIGGTGATFNNLTIGNAISLSGIDVTVSATLALGANVLTTGANKVVVSATGASVTRTSGFVNGNLQRTFAAGGSTVVFDVGAGSTYAPISVTAAGANAGGTLLGSTTSGQHPNYATSGLSATQYVNRYWTLTAGTLTVTGYNATFTFVPGDLIGSPNTAALLVRRWNGATWPAPVSSSSTATTVTGTTFGTAFGAFASGN